MKPTFTVLTGADDNTDVARMKSLQDRFAVEWGILFSPKLQGQGRYPSLGFVASLAGRGLNLAAHVCGGHARAAARGDGLDVLKVVPKGTFRRIQFNLGKAPDLAVLEHAALVAGAQRAIVQCRGDEFPATDVVDWLFDQSGGTGATPTAWPRPTPRAEWGSVGFAGGIGPGNVARTLEAINLLNPRKLPFFIDMESKLRVDDAFDLDLCEDVLTQVSRA